jgi:glutamate--cysteine ligase catalytic subunit
VECQIVSFDHNARKATLSLKQEETLEKLPKNGMYHPEFAKYMIETTPLKPFNSSIKSLLEVEGDLRGRRQKINESLSSHERLLTLSVFPMLGTEPLTDPNVPEQPSLNIDGVISDGPYSLAKDNIQARSNHEPDIRVPTFRDTHTKLPKHLHLNHILFGPGGCGLQATFQCNNLRDARVLHDQLVVLGPIFLALTAATPVYQGVLVDTDVRWNQTASAVDDRAEDELSQVAERWSTAPMFLREGEDVTGVDDKLHPAMRRRVKQDTEFLQEQGMDPVMASYFAHLHLRDPLYLSAKAGKHEEVTPDAVHKSICASVWSHVRLKLPEPDDSTMGWRVEFRPMEVQLTDSANAAVLIFLDLVRQVLSSEGNGSPLQLWMPLDLVKENMDRAHARNAVTEQKFWFPLEGKLVEMTLDQIVHGDESLGFDQGLMRLVEGLLKDITPDAGGDSKAELQSYLDLTSCRVRGEEPTPAQWMRRFIVEHADYKKNSVVPDSTCYDMLTAIAKME